MMTLSTYYMDVYGCQMNVHDSEIIAGILEADGFTNVDNPGSADVILLVSCAVREHAETRVLGRASQLGGLWQNRKQREPLIVLCGCVAQEHGHDLLDRFPNLDLVVGPDCYKDLPLLIQNSRRQALVEFRKGDYTGIDPLRKRFPGAFVTIMRGCNNFCSYCIVPYVRGRERSRSADSIIKEIRDLSEKGYREITLLGQNVNSYHELDTSFPELLDKASDAAGSAWIRFVTSHPRDFNRETVEVMVSKDNICNHLHLPVQSGSDGILHMMNRGYTITEYLEKIRMLRDAIPEIELTTDIITGFPGESEEDFQRTVSLLDEIRYDNAFLFKYSERTGTSACDLGDVIPEHVRLKRLNYLQEFQRGITLEKSGNLKNRILSVLVTGSAKKPDQQAARTRGNRMVILQGTDYEPGTFVDVRIIRADGWTHFGEPVGVKDI